MLQQFNAFNENSDSYIAKHSVITDDYTVLEDDLLTGNKAKIMMLNDWLLDNGLPIIKSYNENDARKNRQNTLQGLSSIDYPNLILETENR